MKLFLPVNIRIYRAFNITMSLIMVLIGCVDNTLPIPPPRITPPMIPHPLSSTKPESSILNISDLFALPSLYTPPPASQLAPPPSQIAPEFRQFHSIQPSPDEPTQREEVQSMIKQSTLPQSTSHRSSTPSTPSTPSTSEEEKQQIKPRDIELRVFKRYSKKSRELKLYEWRCQYCGHDNNNYQNDTRCELCGDPKGNNDKTFYEEKGIEQVDIVNFMFSFLCIGAFYTLEEREAVWRILEWPSEHRWYLERVESKQWSAALRDYVWDLLDAMIMMDVNLDDDVPAEIINLIKEVVYDYRPVLLWLDDTYYLWRHYGLPHGFQMRIPLDSDHYQTSKDTNIWNRFLRYCDFERKQTEDDEEKTVNGNDSYLDYLYSTISYEESLLLSQVINLNGYDTDSLFEDMEIYKHNGVSNISIEFSQHNSNNDQNVVLLEKLIKIMDSS